MISTLVGDWVRFRIRGVGQFLARTTHLSPNAFTILGLLFNIVVAVILGTGNLLLGGIVAIIAGLFDMLDGAVARVTDQITVFGGFFDSTLDRYAESAVYFGLLVYFINNDAGSTAVLLTFATIVGSIMVSYTRARAEAAGISASVGWFARPERVVVLAVFLIVGQPLWGLWILAILTNLTAFQRIFHVWQTTRGTDRPPRSRPSA